MLLPCLPLNSITHIAVSHISDIRDRTRASCFGPRCRLSARHGPVAFYVDPLLLLQMLDVPPAYFYTQPGATGPGSYDNMAPQDWQVDLACACLPVVVVLAQNSKGHTCECIWLAMLIGPLNRLHILHPRCPLNAWHTDAQDGGAVTGDLFNPHQQTFDQPGVIRMRVIMLKASTLFALASQGAEFVIWT